MTKFLDGPAKGQVLSLKRAARFLRVTDCAGKWDALDQPEDTPNANEKLHAYQVSVEVGMYHMRMSKGSGFYAMASYKLVEVQPSDETMRLNETWREWCMKQKAT